SAAGNGPDARHARSGLPRGAPGRPAGAAPARLFAFPAARGRHARGNGGNMTLALLGNPNSGKTTLFNAMTGMRQHVGNFPGVTVERVQGPLRLSKGADVLVDLPGTYSLTAFSREE